MSAGKLASSAFAATHFSASAAALSWALCEWVQKGRPSVLGAASGMVAGLATITPAAGYVGAFVIDPRQELGASYDAAMRSKVEKGSSRPSVSA